MRLFLIIIRIVKFKFENFSMPSTRVKKNLALNLSINRKLQVNNIRQCCEENIIPVFVKKGKTLQLHTHTSSIKTHNLTTRSRTYSTNKSSSICKNKVVHILEALLVKTDRSCAKYESLNRRLLKVEAHKTKRQRIFHHCFFLHPVLVHNV